jgi:hypothetical protein
MQKVLKNKLCLPPKFTNHDRAKKTITNKL